MVRVSDEDDKMRVDFLRSRDEWDAAESRKSLARQGERIQGVEHRVSNIESLLLQQEKRRERWYVNIWSVIHGVFLALVGAVAAWWVQSGPHKP